MKQIITTTLTIAKPQRLTLFLITMLLLPNTAWGEGENYDLWIGETQVTSTNASDITGDRTVSFEAPNTLTLNNATLTVGIKSSLSSLTIQLKGNSSIITNGSCIYTEGNTETLTIISGEQAGGDCSLTLQNKSTENSVIKGFTNMGEGSLTSSSNAAYNKDTKSLCSSTDNSKVITAVTYAANYYNISIGQTQIAKGIDNVVGEGITSGTVTFDGSTNTLTLDNAIIDHITSWIGNLTIKVKGANTISSNSIPIGSTSPENYSLTITKETDGDEASIDIINTTTANTAIFGFFSLTYTGFIPYDSNSDSKKFIALNYDSSSKELKNTSGSSINHVFFKEGSVYPLQIGDTQVTSENASNILNDGKVSFTPANGYNASTISTWATLTLDNATINGSIEWSETAYPNLRIVVNGTSEVITEDGTTVIPAIKFTGTGEPTVHISKNSTDATLLIASSRNKGASNGSVFSGVNSTIGVDDGLHQTTLYPDDNENYLIKYTCYTTAKVYDLAVAGIQVHEISSDFQGYKDHILKGQLENSVYTRNTTVTFDGTQLTQNNAAIETSSSANAIKTGINISINLIGTNTITTASGYAFSRSSQESRTVSFTTSSSPAGTLTLSKSLDPQGLTSGITLDTTGGWTVTYSGSATSLENATQAIITKGALTGIEIAGTLITSEYLDGNGVISGVSGITSGTVKFTPADNTASPATPATLTLNGAKITGTVSWTNSAPLTIAINGTNSITTTDAYAIEGNNQDNTTLTIAKVSETGKCKLILSGSSVGSISGFKNSSDTYAGSGLVYYEDQAEHTATILSTLSGSGTSTDPYLIETPEDLKDFSFFVNKQIITNKYIKIANNIDCKDLEGFESIGSSYPFMGTLSGYGNTISNLTINSGLGFFGHISGGIVNDLNFYKLSVKGNSYATGGIASELSAGGQIDNCTLTECTIACLDNQYSPEVGGIVARLSDSGSKISNCVVYNSTINASTTYTGGSGPIGYAGGIVASYSSGTITNCHVKDGSKLINVNADGGSTLKTGALIGNLSSGTTTSITSNFYYYDVTVETQLGSSDKETKSGYTPRGTSDNTEDPTGAMLYTKNVIIPISTDAGHVSIGSDYYYQVTSDDTNATYSIAPDVEVVISVENADVEGSYTLEGAKTIELKPKEGSTGLYTFDMPNADVTFTVQEAAAVHFSETEGQIYASYYNATKDVAVPMGMTAYIVTGVSEDGTKVIVSPVSYIKKGVAVLIEKDKTTEVSETTDFSGSKLIYAENEVPVTTESKLYVLYQNQFVKVTSGTQIPTGKNYLDLSTFTNAGTRGFYNIGGANDGTSALRGVTAEGTNGKSDAWFTLQGRRLSAKPTKPGLYLHNGIKVVIK